MLRAAIRRFFSSSAPPAGGSGGGARGPFGVGRGPRSPPSTSQTSPPASSRARYPSESPRAGPRPQSEFSSGGSRDGSNNRARGPFFSRDVGGGAASQQPRSSESSSPRAARGLSPQVAASGGSAGGGDSADRGGGAADDEGEFTRAGKAAVEASLNGPRNTTEMPESDPPLVDDDVVVRARGNEPNARLDALSSNAYGWSEAMRSAREAPLWMVHETLRADSRLARPPRDAFLERKDVFAPISIPQRDAQGRAFASGGRKTSTAQVWVKLGDGSFTVNGLPLERAFDQISHRRQAIEPLVASQSVGAWDVEVRVNGGGVSGQAGAIKHGLAKALARYEPQLKPIMRSCASLPCKV